MSTSPIMSYDQLTGYVETAETKQTDLLDKDVFLNLLVTQMQYQDPMDPMDNQQFLDQLASLTTVEELRNSNENLQTLQLYQASINNAQSVSMIGKEVKATGDKVTLAEAGADADLSFLLSGEATTADITIYDSSGTVVRTITKTDLDETDLNTHRWDGLDKNGSPVAAGDYTFEVSAQDIDGAKVDATTMITGVVTGVSFGSGGPELLINGQKVMIGDVYEVSSR